MEIAPGREVKVYSTPAAQRVLENLILEKIMAFESDFDKKWPPSRMLQDHILSDLQSPKAVLNTREKAFIDSVSIYTMRKVISEKQWEWLYKIWDKQSPYVKTVFISRIGNA